MEGCLGAKKAENHPSSWCHIRVLEARPNLAMTYYFHCLPFSSTPSPLPGLYPREQGQASTAGTGLICQWPPPWLLPPAQGAWGKQRGCVQVQGIAPSPCLSACLQQNVLLEAAGIGAPLGWGEGSSCGSLYRQLQVPQNVGEERRAFTSLYKNWVVQHPQNTLVATQLRISELVTVKNDLFLSQKTVPSSRKNR